MANFHEIQYLKLAGAVIGKGGHNIQKLRTEVCTIFNTFFSREKKKFLSCILSSIPSKHFFISILLN